MKNFSVTDIEGKNYAKLSGDRNFIHTDKITGYNSLFGHNIVYGTLIILKFLNKVKINKNYLSINIVFNKAFKYNDSIEIKKKNNLNYKLLQNNEICCYISFSDQSKFNTKLKKATFQKKYIISQTNKKKFSFKGIALDLSVALLYLSKYVGNIYPGSNSLIAQININIINNKINLGLGYALTRGYDSSKYPFVIFLDADLSISEEDILKLYKSRKDDSMIIGSRYIRGSKINGANKLKVLISYCLNYIIGKIFNLKIIDISHSFRIISKKIEIKTKNYTHPGFFWEMTVNAKRKNKTIEEIPITFIERKYGISKNKSLLMLSSVIKSFFNILK